MKIDCKYSSGGGDGGVGELLLLFNGFVLCAFYFSCVFNINK